MGGRSVLIPRGVDDDGRRAWRHQHLSPQKRMGALIPDAYRDMLSLPSWVGGARLEVGVYVSRVRVVIY